MLRPTKLRYYLAAMKARGIPAAAVLADSGIAEDQLHDPALLIDAGQYETVICNMIRLTGNPALGFEIGGNVKLVDFGILAHAMMTSATLREAIALWLRFSNLVGMTIRIKIEEHDAKWCTIIDTLGAHEPVRHFCTEEILMTGIKLGEMLSDTRHVTQSCDIAYPPPPHAASYAKFLGCPVRFNAKRTRLVTSFPDLDAPLRGADPEFNEICLRHCGQIMRQIASRSPVVAQLRSLFLARSGNIPSLDEAALHLGMSPRSIRRYLQDEGTHYQALVDEFRFELAQEYLKSEQLTPKEIGHKLGYSNITAFRRAFKAWSGKTVQQFRDEI